MARALQSARATDSLGNLRQIGSALVLFAAEHEGRLPNGDGYEYALRDYLHSSLNIRTVFISQNADKNPRVQGSVIPITYSVHGTMLATNPASGGLGQLVSAPRCPARLILVADGNQAPNNFWQANHRFQNPSEYVYGSYAQFTEEQLKTPLDGSWGGRGVGPDQASPNAGWFRYCNNGAVAGSMTDGHAELIPKGQVRAENLVPF